MIYMNDIDCTPLIPVCDKARFTILHCTLGIGHSTIPRLVIGIG
jgi:hypothetical protein